jgi:hypothetical protein
MDIFEQRSGNSIKFVFEYPDGPFHNTFTWDERQGRGTFWRRVKIKRASGLSSLRTLLDNLRSCAGANVRPLSQHMEVQYRVSFLF